MQKYAHLNRAVKKLGHSYTNQEKMGQSYTFFLEKGAYRIPGCAEKGGYSGRTSVPCVIYRELPPPQASRHSL